MINTHIYDGWIFIDGTSAEDNKQANEKHSDNFCSPSVIIEVEFVCVSDFNFKNNFFLSTPTRNVRMKTDR